jgi:hypothetical protein
MRKLSFLFKIVLRSEIPSDLRDPLGGVVAPQPVSQFDDTDRSEPLDTDQQGE